MRLSNTLALAAAVLMATTADARLNKRQLVDLNYKPPAPGVVTVTATATVTVETCALPEETPTTTTTTAEETTTTTVEETPTTTTTAEETTTTTTVAAEPTPTKYCKVWSDGTTDEDDQGEDDDDQGEDEDDDDQGEDEQKRDNLAAVKRALDALNKRAPAPVKARAVRRR